MEILRDSFMIYLFLAFQLFTWYLIKQLRLKLMPVKVFVCTWMVASCLYLAPFITYEFKPSYLVLVFLLLIYSSFITGCIFAEAKRNNRVPIKFNVKIEKTLLFLLSSIALIVFLYSAYKIFDSFGSSNIKDIRAELWEDKGFETYSYVDRVMNKLKPLVLLFLASAPLLWVRSYKKTALLVSLGGVGICLDGLSQGGRAYFVILIFDTFFALMLMRTYERPSYDLFTRNVRSYLNVFYILLPLLLYFLVFYLPSQRVETFTVEDASGVLYRMEKGIFTDFSVFLADILGGGFLVSLLSLQYFMQPMSNLSFFVDEIQVQEWYEMGNYNLPLIFREGGLAVREDIAIARIRYGMGPNPWSSVVRDILVDFGPYLGSVVSFLYGYLSTRLAKILILDTSLINVGLMGLVLSGILLFPYFNIFHMGPFTLAVIYAFLIYIVMRLVSKRGVKSE